MALGEIVIRGSVKEIASSAFFAEAYLGSSLVGASADE
jgi:hypothetical protein